MTTLPIDTRSRLPQDELFHLSESLVQSLEVLEGAIWISQRRSPRDLVVVAGEAVTLDCPVAAIVGAIDGTAVVEARTLASWPGAYAAAA